MFLWAVYIKIVSYLLKYAFHVRVHFKEIQSTSEVTVYRSKPKNGIREIST